MTILDGSYQCGMLVDTDIKRALELLFSSNASPDKAKYSTYEIVVDKGYKKITYNEEDNLTNVTYIIPVAVSKLLREKL